VAPRILTYRLLCRILYRIVRPDGQADGRTSRMQWTFGCPLCQWNEIARLKTRAKFNQEIPKISKDAPHLDWGCGDVDAGFDLPHEPHMGRSLHEVQLGELNRSGPDGSILADKRSYYRKLQIDESSKWSRASVYRVHPATC
jgi:hypothetical protein